MQAGDVALITGASTGIGASTAVSFAKAGFVTFAAMRGPLTRPEAENMRKAGCQIVELDVTSNASSKACFEEVIAKAGRIDILINNAGVNGEVGPVEATTDEGHMSLMQANYFGAARMIRLCVPGMRERGRGAVMNVTSIAARYWAPMQGGYNASKAALEALSVSLAQEVARFGVRVCSIRPGVIITPLLTKSAPPRMESMPAYLDQLRHFVKFFQASGGLQQGPELVADKMLQLLQDASAWKAGYDVGFDATTLSAIIQEKGYDWLVAEGGKVRMDAEQVAMYAAMGIDVSSAYRKAKL